MSKVPGRFRWYRLEPPARMPLRSDSGHIIERVRRSGPGRRGERRHEYLLRSPSGWVSRIVTRHRTLRAAKEAAR